MRLNKSGWNTFVVGVFVVSACLPSVLAHSEPEDVAWVSGSPCAWMLPTTGEWLVAIAKGGQPNLAALKSAAIPTKSTSRAQIAFFIGLNLAYGHVASAEGNQRVLINRTRDILTLAESLGIADKLASRMKVLHVAANAAERMATARELDKLLEVTCETLNAQHDQPMELFVHLGVFVGSLSIMTNPALGIEPFPTDFLNVREILADFDASLQSLPTSMAGDQVGSALTDFIRSLIAIIYESEAGDESGRLATKIFEQTHLVMDTLTGVDL